MVKDLLASAGDIGMIPGLGMSAECMLLGSISSQQRFGVTDVKALSVSQLSGLGQTVV